METIYFRAISNHKERIDFLLDKISTQGIDNLTQDELKWLDMASQGPESMEQQTKRVMNVIESMFKTLRMDRHMSKNGRVIHFSNPVSKIILATVTEITDDVYNLYVRYGFIECIVEKMDNSVSAYDVDEYLREYVREKYGFQVQKICELS